MPALERVLYSGFLAEGDDSRAFEDAFSRAINNPNVLAVSSGSAALHLALAAAHVTSDSEVISTPVTAEPTNVVIRQTGARIVWADCDPQSGLIDPASVERKITPRTKAVVAVDYAGTPVDLDALTKITTEHGIALIEDAAQAFGARYHDAPLGGQADFTVFSFQAIKRLTCGDGGALAFKNPDQLERIRRLRWFGMDRTLSRADQWIEEVGFKYTMNNITAALARVQLENIGDHLERQIENGTIFDEALANMRNVEPIRIPPNASSSYWLYTALAEDRDRRDDFLTRFDQAGIAAGSVHRRNDLHPIFTESRAPLPGVDAFYERMFHLPCGWWVGELERSQILSVLAERA